jgi:hypothetical protein
MGKLNPTQIYTLPPATYGDGNNFYLVVKKAGAWSYLLRKQWQGRPQKGPSCEVFITLFFQSSYLIDCTAAVRPERHGNVANPNTLRRHLSSEHHDPGAEASCQATEAAAARGCPQHRTQHRVPWESAIANHSSADGCARVSISEACQA